MKPYYQDKWVTIYHGNCQEILPRLDVKVDLVLTDIPFNVKKQYGMYQDDLPLEEYIVFIDSVFGSLPLAEVNSVLIKVPTLYLPYLRFGGLTYKWTLGFYTPNSMKSFSKGFNQLGLVLWLYQNQPLKVNFANDVYWHNRDGNLRSDGEKHPNPMDISFVERLIADYSESNNLVLDPFLGSGTTCFCAKKLNRYSVGIEIEERYAEIAAKRCSQEVMEFNL